MSDIPEALVEKGRAALREVQESWGEYVPSSETRMRARAVLAAVWPDLPAARPVVDRDALRQELRDALHDFLEMDDGLDRITDALLASGVVADAADVRRAVAEETLLATANFVEREAAAAWGGDAAWLTTGKHVAAVVAGLLREHAREAAQP